MKHFKKDNQIFAFEADGSQDHLITGDMEAQTPEQVATFLAPTAEQLEAEEQERFLSELKTIDAKSVGSLREFILTKFAGDADLPSFLVDYEAEAQTKRAKLK